MTLRDPSDELQKIFPTWPIDRRAVIWIWNWIRQYRPLPITGSIDSVQVRNSIAAYLNRTGRVNELGAARDRTLLPQEDFSWVEPTGRQASWLIIKLEEIQTLPEITIPSDITRKELLIAYFDCIEAALPTKKDYLIFLKRAWVERQVDELGFSWYLSSGQEKLKCRTAWEWYQAKHPDAAEISPIFRNLEDIIAFLDRTAFKPDEKRYHLEQIKKKYKALETKAGRQNKRQTNLSLSDESRSQLNALARESGMTKTQLVEHLILSATVYGLPR